jgi:protein TonB
MFERTLAASWDERSRRGLTTLTSFGFQALAVGALLVLPLLRPTGMPSFRQLSTPISLGQPLGEPPQVRAQAGANTAVTNTSPSIVLRQPPRIPLGMPSAGDDAQPPIAGSGPYIGVGVTTGSPSGVWDSSGTHPIIPAAPAAAVHSVRLSHMSEGDLVHKVLPTYPPLARSARIQGTVVLQAMISKLGTIVNLRLLSGHPLLAPAAIDAVSHWRYRPYILNNEPVEVETQITVNFSLAGN